MPKFITHGEEETIALGREFARHLRPGDVVALFGDLGAGKTRFLRGVCEGLGVAERVSSPTFTIVHEYTGAHDVVAVYHFDFYRLHTLREIEEIGFDEYLTSGGICLIEWAEKAMPLLPAGRIDIRLSLGESADVREIFIKDVPDEVAA